MFGRFGDPVAHHIVNGSVQHIGKIVLPAGRAGVQLVDDKIFHSIVNRHRRYAGNDKVSSISNTDASSWPAWRCRASSSAVLMIIDGIDHLQQTVRAGFQHQQFDLLVVKLRVEFIMPRRIQYSASGIDGAGHGFAGITNIIVQQIGDFDDSHRYIP